MTTGLQLHRLNFQRCLTEALATSGMISSSNFMSFQERNGLHVMQCHLTCKIGWQQLTQLQGEYKYTVLRIFRLFLGASLQCSEITHRPIPSLHAILSLDV